jgi:c-di-GMP-related signal transduction protein
MYIARQPIFNRDLTVYGYELLFRPDRKSNQFGGASSVCATASVVEELFEAGFDPIVEDKFAFINCDGDFINSNTIELINSEKLVIEVLESTKFNGKTINMIKELKDKGYLIALDDFDNNFYSKEIISLADIIKFDLLATPLDSIENNVQEALKQGKLLIAEKVENEGVYEMAHEMGFHLFQGYFFSKPKIVCKTNGRCSAILKYTNILKELQSQEPSYDILTELIGSDPELTYRLLRVVSKGAKNRSISSIKMALTFLGFKEIEKWITLLMLQDLGKSKPLELTKLSIVRAKYAELIADSLKREELSEQAYMVGLFSVIDAMLDMPMAEALDGLSLSSSISDALIYNKGSLALIFNLVLAYEQGNWELVDNIIDAIHLDEKHLYDLYKAAIDWAGEVMQLIA